MKDGDIYFWSWKNPSDHMPYHCWSQKAVVENGVLYDTFWSDHSRHQVNPNLVDLEYQGNINEMTEILNPVYFRPADIVDMRHSNSSRAKIYLKPAAQRDAATMREHIEYEIERSKSEIRAAQHRVEALQEALLATTTGQLDDVLL